MRRAIEDILDAIRTIANLLPVPLEDEDGNPRDLTLVFCETKQIMDGNVRSVSQIQEGMLAHHGPLVHGDSLQTCAPSKMFFLVLALSLILLMLPKIPYD